MLVVLRGTAVIHARGLLQYLATAGTVVPDPSHINEFGIVNEPPQAITKRLPEIVEGIARVRARGTPVRITDHRVSTLGLVNQKRLMVKTIGVAILIRFPRCNCP